MIFSSLQNIKIEHVTPSRTLIVEKYTTPFPITSVVTDKARFSDLCKNGCVNYGNKYSCPPFSPTFEKVSRECNNRLGVIFYRILLDQYSDSTLYNRIRASNSVLKSMLDKELLSYKMNGYRVVGSGSCRACKPCGAKEGARCKKPEKLIFSLESLGVDVNQLVQDCFSIRLEWYKKGMPQKYTSVVGCILQKNI